MSRQLRKNIYLKRVCTVRYNTDEFIKDIRSRLSDARFYHSMCVADEAMALAKRYGGDPHAAYAAGILHDVLKEQPRDEALRFFASHGVKLSPVELAAPKLWHAIAGAVYITETYAPEQALVDAVRYHTTGRVGMSLPEKILFVADFISADRDYPGVEDMRARAKISLAYAMEEGLRFTVYELSERGAVIHPDTVACYNEIVLSQERK